MGWEEQRETSTIRGKVALFVVHVRGTREPRRLPQARGRGRSMGSQIPHPREQALVDHDAAGGHNLHGTRVVEPSGAHEGDGGLDRARQHPHGCQLHEKHPSSSRSRYPACELAALGRCTQHGTHKKAGHGWVTEGTEGGYKTA